MRYLENDGVGQRQQMILQCIWDADGAATVPNIIDRLEEKCGIRLSSSAVNTMVQILLEKGLVTQTEKVHHAFLYRTAVTREEFRVRELKRVRKLTFDDSSRVLLASMIDAGVTEEELEEALQLLRAKKEEK